jgi:hypothetical protein
MGEEPRHDQKSLDRVGLEGSLAQRSNSLAALRIALEGAAEAGANDHQGGCGKSGGRDCPISESEANSA